MGSGFKDFSPGNVLTASDVDGYLMRQTMMTFASAAARDSALSGVLDEGMLAYLEDSDSITFYTGSGWLTVRMPWTTYTPTLTQSGAVTKTVTYAKWRDDSQLVTVNFRLDITGSGSAGTPVSFGLPGTSTSNGAFGAGSILDISAGQRYVCSISSGSSTTVVFGADGITTSGWGQGPSVALASGDIIVGSLTYEAA